MAGRSHWSVSVEEDSPSDSLIFDVACRVQQGTGWLGSTYRLSGSAQIGAVRGETATVGDLPVLIAVEPADGGPSLTVGQDGKSISIAPSLAHVDPPATIRWKYGVGLCG
jgi:hypothetical protein